MPPGEVVGRLRTGFVQVDHEQRGPFLDLYAGRAARGLAKVISRMW